MSADSKKAPSGSLANIGLEGDESGVGGDEQDARFSTILDGGQEEGKGDETAGAEGAAAIKERLERLEREHQNLQKAYGDQANELGVLRQRGGGQQPGWDTGGYGYQQQQPAQQQYAGWGQQQPGPQGTPGQAIAQVVQQHPELMVAWNQLLTTGDPSQFFGALARFTDQQVMTRVTGLVQDYQRRANFERDFFVQNPALEHGEVRTVFNMALGSAQGNSMPGTPVQAIYDAAKRMTETVLTQFSSDFAEGGKAATQEAGRLQGTKARGARQPGGPTPQTPEQLMAGFTQEMGQMHRQRQAKTRRPRGEAPGGESS